MKKKKILIMLAKNHFNKLINKCGLNFIYSLFNLTIGNLTTHYKKEGYKLIKTLKQHTFLAMFAYSFCPFGR